MFFSDRRRIVMSVGDLVDAAHCEYAMLRKLDQLLGRIPSPGATEFDSAWQKLLQRGRQHERRVLEGHREQFGRNAVVEIPRVAERSEGALHAAAEATLAALRSGAAVVHQAVVFDGRLLGYADFVIRDADDRWRVEDAKLTGAAIHEGRLQVGAYASMLADAGVQLAASGVLVLGDGTEHPFSLDDVVPAFVQGRDRLERIVSEHAASGRAASWADPTVSNCGRCSHCFEAIADSRDLLLVDGVRAEERATLHALGIRTIDELASVAPAVTEGWPTALHRLRRRALLQLKPGDLPNAPAYEVIREELLGRLPAPDPGDLFLSFAAQAASTTTEDAQDHLFTVTSVDGTTRTYWGDDRRHEGEEFARFLSDLEVRHRRNPGMHVFHYSPAERPHLLDLAQAAGVGQDRVDALIHTGRLIDLFSVVDESMLLGTPNRSLREVGRVADPELAHALAQDDAATQRAEYRLLLAQGELQRAEDLRGLVERQNAERCVLTRLLRDWLMHVAAARGVQPGSVPPPARGRRAPSPIVRALENQTQRDAQPVHEFTIAALDYHRLEDSVFWRAHERRLHRHTSEWSTRTRGAARVLEGLVEQDWTTGARGGLTRTLRLRLEGAPGTSLKPDEQPFLVYDGRPVFEDERASPGARSVTGGMVVERTGDEVLVLERAPRGVAPWETLPGALAPSRPPRTSAIEARVEEWAERVLHGEDDADPVSDLVRRRAPRLQTGAVARIEGIDGRLDAHASLMASIEDLDGSFLAVQGPPGSGKTTVGARAIAELVQRGWKIGVVAQSHAVVEHFLDQVVASGADANRVAKHVPREAEHRFTSIGKDRVRSFMRDHGDGFVVGGTAWTFTNTRHVPHGSLDLLVIDEAGQFGLVKAIAVAQSARNLLLLGDPQQLPQVSQASHRAAADSSALGWLLDGQAVLPERFGYFLDRTWRLHPALTRVVSDLSYNGALTSHAQTKTRSLVGVAPGLHLRPVRHLGRTDSSEEEAGEVLRIVRELVGRPWRERAAASERPLSPADVIVVAPYSAQVETISDVLRGAGLNGVEVGTVDRFQGREAAVAVYTTTVSNLALRPEGADFVLGRNRLNVAISRAQWAAFVVHATTLTDFSPRNEKDAAALSRFLRLQEFPRLREDGDAAEPTSA